MLTLIIEQNTICAEGISRSGIVGAHFQRHAA